MKTLSRTAFVVLSAAVTSSVAVEQHVAVGSSLNPIRKVVTMLQTMQKKVEQEGEAEKELYDKFMCYCKSGTGDLSASISSAEDKIPAVGSNIDASEAKLTQSKDNLKQAQVDRSAAKDAMAEATSIREKEAADFAKLKADADANIAAIAKAVKSLETGMTGSFLQSPPAALLRNVVKRAGLPESDQEALASFLSQSTGYAPQSGEITGILKQLGDTMSGDLADATKAEAEAINIYKGVMSAKTNEVAATSSTIEAKTQQIGELGVAIVQMKEDLSDTQAALKGDQQFIAELDKSCSTKTAEWDERSKTRAEELVALADTIKVLNDDDALDLFKRTLPSPSASFVQVQVRTSAIRARALSSIRDAQKMANEQDRPGLELLTLALTGKKSASSGGFGTVIKMIDEMTENLAREQDDDEHQKEYCASQFDLTDDNKKALMRTVDQEANAIATAEEGIATLAEEIASLVAGIKALDKSVAQATEQRKEEHNEFRSLVTSDTASKELLLWAKNRLNQFYNPKLYKPDAKVELSAEDRIVANMGGFVSTAAPSGIADTGITSFTQVSVKDAPAPPPSTWDAYAKKSEKSTGVIAMIDLLIKDLEKELTEATTAEKDAQADYEQMVKDAKHKRTTDSQSLTEKNGAKADLDAERQGHQDGKAKGTKELMATMKYIHSLHSECDWLLQYFDVRKEARAGEIDSLKKARAVLSGASYSLVQERRQSFLTRGHR